MKKKMPKAVLALIIECKKRRAINRQQEELIKILSKTY